MINRAEFYTQIKKYGGIADLSSRSKIHLTGQDRVRFLNGQISRDVHKARNDETFYACVMTAKGKMCGDVFVSSADDFLRLDAESSLRESLIARLERYIISDDVMLEDFTDGESLFHLLGSNAEQISELKNVKSIRSKRFGIIGIDLIMDRNSSASVWEVISRKFSIIDEEMQEVLRIEAGIPRWNFELTEDTIPVEAGLDKTAIDYNKGCYIGQEIISRLKSVGHVNKHLFGFIPRIPGPLNSGMNLFSLSNAEKEVGCLTSVAYSFGLEKYVALGYVKRSCAENLLNARSMTETGHSKECLVDIKELPLIS